VDIDVVTLFPGFFDWFGEQRHVRNARSAGHRLDVVDPRAHTPLPAGQVDDAPFGGGAGMVLRVDVIEAALRARYGIDPARLPARRRVIALVAGGRPLDDALVGELVREPALTLLCGRYEGFDERILEHFTSDRVSIGRYVLSGGELAAMVLCDTVLRRLPGVLGDERSAVEESFSAALDGAPEYPHYTRPARFRDWGVPEVLLSGHHARIEAWRREQSARRATRDVREAAGGTRAIRGSGRQLG
jgi:tRNA (guanine37-N1)-methyltransferase